MVFRPVGGRERFLYGTRGRGWEGWLGVEVGLHRELATRVFQSIECQLRIAGKFLPIERKMMAMGFELTLSNFN